MFPWNIQKKGKTTKVVFSTAVRSKSCQRKITGFISDSILLCATEKSDWRDLKWMVDVLNELTKGVTVRRIFSNRKDVYKKT